MFLIEDFLCVPEVLLLFVIYGKNWATCCHIFRCIFLHFIKYNLGRKSECFPTSVGFVYIHVSNLKGLYGTCSDKIRGKIIFLLYRILFNISLLC